MKKFIVISSLIVAVCIFLDFYAILDADYYRCITNGGGVSGNLSRALASVDWHYYLLLPFISIALIVAGGIFLRKGISKWMISGLLVASVLMSVFSFVAFDIFSQAVSGRMDCDGPLPPTALGDGE